MNIPYWVRGTTYEYTYSQCTAVIVRTSKLSKHWKMIWLCDLTPPPFFPSIPTTVVPFGAEYYSGVLLVLQSTTVRGRICCGRPAPRRPYYVPGINTRTGGVLNRGGLEVNQSIHACCLSQFRPGRRGSF